jgi:integrase
MPGWVLQRSRRPKGWYFQAIHGRGAGRVAVTLGYLSQEQVALAEESIGIMGHPRTFVGVSPDNEGDPLPVASREKLAWGVRLWLLDGAEAFVNAFVAEASRRDALSLEAEGRYGEMKFRDYLERVYLPYRRATNAKQAKREKWIWDRVLEFLGNVRVKNLTPHRWNMFLLQQSTWCPRTRQIVQQTYKAALVYAVNIGGLEAVHEMEVIRGGNRRYTDAGEALTEDEVVKVLDSAATKMHRALFATAIGQGTRPGEVVSLCWEDVDWDAGFLAFRGASKNQRAGGRVPITPLTHRELKSWWLERGEPSRGHAFTWYGRPIKNWTKAWKTAVRKSGIDPDGSRRLMPYCARYTFATLAAVAGVPRAAVRAGMRHTNHSRILETVYERLREEQVARALAGFPDCAGPARGGDEGEE